MERRSFLAGAASCSALASGAFPRPSLAQAARDRVLRFVPQTDLASPDPVWSTATIATIHGFMVWDTLYGVDGKLVPRPQMCSGSEVSADGLTWTFTLRDGLVFHDATPVRAADCVASVRRWAERNPFGVMLASRLAEMRALNDRRFEMRLREPFGPMLFALGSTSCFMMPERLAATSASKALTEFVGSGPFRFVADRWVPGARAEYARFDRYAPRQEPPDFYSGGKVVHFDRVEWIVQPDPSTAASALQANEVDWVEQPLLDLLPTLKSARGLKVAPLDPLGTVDMLIFNQLQPPFNNEKLRRALLPALDQTTFLQAIVGDEMELGRAGVGFFPLGTASASTVGMDALTGPRDLALARRLIAESGYDNEPIVVLEPSDVAQLRAVAQIAGDLFKQLGLNVRQESLDLGAVVARRIKKDPVGQGGWSCAPVQWNSLPIATPLSNPLSAVGATGWTGWPTSQKRAELQRRWTAASADAERRTICDEIQREAFESVPFLPVAQYYQPAAFRSDLTDFVKASFSVFWGVRRA